MLAGFCGRKFPVVTVRRNKPFWHKYLEQLKKILNDTDWRYPLLKGINKHKYDEIKVYWYNHLIVIRTGCEIYIK